MRSALSTTASPDADVWEVVDPATDGRAATARSARTSCTTPITVLTVTPVPAIAFARPREAASSAAFVTP